MANLVIVGLQWGDEGKGKVVDFLSEYFDIVARFQGGPNAGHTIVINGQTHKFRLLPAGAIRGKTVVIGNGVVLDPLILKNEVSYLKERGITVDLLLSDRAHVITPYHIQLDGLQESFRGAKKIGTTRRGIGPTYAGKIERIGLRVCDILSAPESLPWETFRKLTGLKIEQLYSASLEIDYDEFLESFQQILREFEPNIGDCGEFLLSAIESGKRILFEGAQGTLLDIDHGTYPFVTSSNCVSGAAAIGTGVPPSVLDAVLGVTKSYTTRVGAGPFPTEISNEIGRLIQQRGREFGTVTGRPRRCGWLDLVALKYAVRLNGSQYLAITKVDVLTGLTPLKVCVAYDIDGEETKRFPADNKKIDQVSPIYQELEGWKENPAEVTNFKADDAFDNLPGELREYLSFIEHVTNTKISLISMGPDRSQTILRSHELFS